MFVFASFELIGDVSTSQATTFPYSTRTKDYSGWSPDAQSDTNTTGMAGATVALPSSVSSAQLNPAGYAMETAALSAQINRVSVVDKQIQPDGQQIDSSQWGLGVSPSPWGFAISYYSPITENALYTSPNTGTPLNTETSLKEFRFTVARSFFEGRLAVGVSAVLAKAVREIGSLDYDDYKLSYQVGALYRIADHVIFGANYIPHLTIGPGTDEEPQNEMPGFDQSLLRPSELDFGAGWVPNRFFKVGISISYVGDTANTALLANQMTVGANPTWIPRAGASYKIAQYSHFESELAVGTYYATSRVLGNPSRLHATLGLDANPYFVNTGVGFDLSSNYHNIMIGIGVDIVRTLRLFKIIPKDPTPPYDGFFPPATVVSAEGMSDAMTYGEARKTSPPTVSDVGKIVKELPANLEDKMKGLPTSIEKKEAAKKKKAHKESEKSELSPQEP